jgi:hypothetical protein
MKVLSEMALLAGAELPADFQYPSHFQRLFKLGIRSLEPWSLLEGERLRQCSAGLTTRYPVNYYVPFAARQDNDDLACWR